MSITTALRSALSSLKVTQETISLAGHNIANANTPGYTKQDIQQASISTGGSGQGVEIIAIVSRIDQQLVKSIRSQETASAETDSLNEFLDLAQALYGQPGSESSLNTVLDSFFSSLQNLSVNPELPSLRQDTLNKAQTLVDKIATLATKLEDLRFEADQEIAASVSQANTIINELFELNGRIKEFPPNSSARAEAINTRELKIRQLASLMNVNVFLDADEQLSLSTGNGAAILDNNLYKISYVPAPSADNFINDIDLSAMTVSATNPDTGAAIGDAVTLISSGSESGITSTFSGGKVEALRQIRDVEIPNLLTQLDSFADTLRDSFNALHNNGSPFPPQQTYTGTRSIANTTEVGFSGKVMIAALNADGTPVSSPYTDEADYRPLTLDLSSLDSGAGSGAGKPTMQTILDEINTYYGPPQNKVSLNNVRSINLASLSNTIADEGMFTFDLELDNTSAQDAIVEVLSVDVIDPIDSSVVYSVPGGSLPAAYTLNAGDRERTGSTNGITVDFSGDDDRVTYTLRVQLRVTDEDGVQETSTIDYNVDESPVTNVRNKRYFPQAVNAGTATLLAAPSNQAFLTAAIVDANGNSVSSGTSGFLQLKGNGSTNYVAISELDSQETGATGASSSSITGRGFSHYFELNNFFVDNGSSSQEDAAVNLSIRSDITSNANLITMGRLALSTQPSDTSLALYTYELGSGNNEAIIEMSKLDQTAVSFAAAAGLPASSQTLSRYISDLIGFVANRATNAESLSEIQKLSLDGFLELFQQASGVNIDAELTNVIEVENTYRASARIITIIDRLLQALMDTF